MGQACVNCPQGSFGSSLGNSSVTSDSPRGFKRSKPDFPISSLIGANLPSPELDLDRLGFVRLSPIIIPDPLGWLWLLLSCPRGVSWRVGILIKREMCADMEVDENSQRGVPWGTLIDMWGSVPETVVCVPFLPSLQLFPPIKWHAGEYRPWNRRKDSWKHRAVDKHKCASVCAWDYITTTRWKQVLRQWERWGSKRVRQWEGVEEEKGLPERMKNCMISPRVQANRFWSPGRCVGGRVIIGALLKAQTLGSHL